MSAGWCVDVAARAGTGSEGQARVGSLRGGRRGQQTLEEAMSSNSVVDCARRLVGLVAVLGAGLLLGGCASNAYPPAPVAAATDDYRYLIGPLDTVNIIVWRNPELSMVIPVRPDGKISTPLVEDLQAIGRNPTDLARDIEKALSKYTRDPVVTVVTTGFQGASSEQIRIIGEAARPQAIPYRQNMTLLDVMIQVGGLTDFADGNSAVLVRGKEAGKQYSVRLKDLIRRGDISANVDVRPGDVLIIPQGWF
jgi:polysaccharide export outer membrane protein